MNRKDILDKTDDILALIQANKPLCAIAKYLGCKQETLVKYLKILGIDYKGCQGKKTNDQIVGYVPAAKYLTYGSKIPSSRLKEKLFKDGYKEKRCEQCGITSWLDKEAPLELHHIDGDKLNNRLDNLQILCPNCHAFTDNFCSKNSKLYKQHKEQHARLAELVDATSSNLVSNLEQEFESPTSHQNLLSTKELNRRKELILNSGVDLTKFGWQAKVSLSTGLTRHQIVDTVSYFEEDFAGLVFKRSSIN